MNMNGDEASGLKFWCVGVVVADKPDDGDMIKVFPSEHLALAKGDLTSDSAYVHNVQGVDHRGANISANISGTNYVVAKWAAMSGGGNRQTAPNVYRSETVALYRFGAQDDIYWEDMFREPSLRKIESVLYSYSNVSAQGVTADLTSSYWFKVSPRDQILQLHTSTNQGEPAGYDIIINTKTGALSIADTCMNSLNWDAVNGALKIVMTTSFEIDTQEITFNGQTFVRTNSPEITETGNNITNNASQAILYESQGTWNANALAVINLNQNVAVAGGVTISEGITTGTSGSGNGNAIINGTMGATGNITAGAGTSGQVDLLNHSHLYSPGDGSPTPTDPPTPLS